MIDFVPGIVLQIEDVFRVTTPRIPKNRAMRFVRDRVCVVAVNRVRPDVEDAALVGRQPGDLPAIW